MIAWDREKKNLRSPQESSSAHLSRLKPLKYQQIDIGDERLRDEPKERLRGRPHAMHWVGMEGDGKIWVRSRKKKDDIFKYDEHGTKKKKKTRVPNLVKWGTSFAVITF